MDDLEARVQVHNRRAGPVPAGFCEVYVGRPSVLGNPFPVRGKGRFGARAREELHWLMDRGVALPVDFAPLTRATALGGFEHSEAAALYLPWLRERCRAPAGDSGVVRGEVLALARRVRAGERLSVSCWCAPEPCHADHVRAAVLGYARRA